MVMAQNGPKQSHTGGEVQVSASSKADQSQAMAAEFSTALDFHAGQRQLRGQSCGRAEVGMDPEQPTPGLKGCSKSPRRMQNGQYRERMHHGGLVATIEDFFGPFYCTAKVPEGEVDQRQQVR